MQLQKLKRMKCCKLGMQRKKASQLSYRNLLIFFISKGDSKSEAKSRKPSSYEETLDLLTKQEWVVTSMLHYLLAWMHLFKVPPHAAWFLWFVVAQRAVISLVSFGTEVLTGRVCTFVDVQCLVIGQNWNVHIVLCVASINFSFPDNNRWIKIFCGALIRPHKLTNETG